MRRKRDTRHVRKGRFRKLLAFQIGLMNFVRGISSSSGTLQRSFTAAQLTLGWKSRRQRGCDGERERERDR